MFTCRTGTKFAYGKSDPIAHPGSSAEVAGKEVRWEAGPEDTVWELLPLNPKSVANVFPRVWKDGQVQFMLRWVGA